MVEAYISFGTNLGDRKKNIEEALSLLQKNPGVKIEKTSSLYLTEPIGYVGQDYFLNGVIMIKTNLSPRELLSLCQQIENHMGRKRTIPWGPRIIDLDILLYNNKIIEEDDLIIPHPYMHKRRFILTPLSEIAPQLIHPVLGKSIYTMLKELKDSKKVEIYSDKIEENNC